VVFRRPAEAVGYLRRLGKPSGISGGSAGNLDVTGPLMRAFTASTTSRSLGFFIG